MLLALVAPGGGTLSAQAPEDGRAADPLQCWWRTSAPAVRIAEPFALLLTCAVTESETRRIVVDQANLSPDAIPLAPFEVIGGGDLTESPSANGRFFQREYRLRVVGDAMFGRDIPVPPVVITYRLQTVTPAGDRSQGIEQRHELPALSVRVVSLVPAEARDIREVATDTFAELDDAVFRASMVTTAGAILAVLGTLGLVTSLVGAVRRRQPAEAIPGTLSDGLVLQYVVRELAVIRRAREAGSWTPALVTRALAALRIGASYATSRAPSQRSLEAHEEPCDGALLHVSRGGRRIVISAATTPRTLERFPNPPDRVTAMQQALGAFTRAQYGQERPPATATLDTGLEAAERVVRDLQRERGWVARQLASASGRFAGVSRMLWSR